MRWTMAGTLETKIRRASRVGQEAANEVAQAMFLQRAGGPEAGAFDAAAVLPPSAAAMALSPAVAAALGCCGTFALASTNNPLCCIHMTTRPISAPTMRPRDSAAAKRNGEVLLRRRATTGAVEAAALFSFFFSFSSSRADFRSVLRRCFVAWAVIERGCRGRGLRGGPGQRRTGPSRRQKHKKK